MPAQNTGNPPLKRILCHTCCAVCCAYPLMKLVESGFQPILYFYNPNIYPDKEYHTRLNELKNHAQKNNYDLIVEEKREKDWQKAISGYENEPEKSKRCEKCFEHRLLKTAQKAKELAINIVTTTLSVSPHKNSKTVFKVLAAVESELEVGYLDIDFKKNDGFLKTMKIAKEENFYKQTYCGCIYSMKAK